MKCHLCLYFVLICLISACGSTPTKVALQPSATLPASTRTPTATQQLIPTATLTKIPKPTSTATVTPSPTATPIILPTKQILMQFGIYGGDGGSPTDAYFGRDTPLWVLYTDGQLIIRKSDRKDGGIAETTLDDKGDWFEEATLTVPQMCSLLSRIQRTGFFEIQGDGVSEKDPIYQRDSTASPDGGGSSYMIQVNGKPYKYLHIYRYWAAHLNSEAKAAFNLFNQYQAPAKLTPYQAQYALLWIEKGKGNLAYATPAPTTQDWPAGLPSIEGLSENTVKTSWYSDDNYREKVSQVLLQGKDVQPILSLFNNQLTGKLFSTSDGEYHVIARPLLPHETPMSLSAYPYDAVEFELPFKCDN